MPSPNINDGGTWRRAMEVHVNDSGTWRNIKSIWINDGGTWRKTYHGGQTTIVAGTNFSALVGYTSGGGSIANGDLSGGLTITAIADQGSQCNVEVSGFSSDPGFSGLYEAKNITGGVSLLMDVHGTAYNWTASGGRALWTFGNKMNFVDGNNYSIRVVLNV
jgi:hypothetical protein